MIKLRSRIRVTVLICAFGAVVLVLGKTTLWRGNTDKAKAIEISLPNEVPLEGWQMISSQGLNDQSLQKPNYLKGKEYQYTQGSIELSVQARYIRGTNGNVQEFMSNYLAISSEKEAWEIHNVEKIGVFLSKAESDRLQISTCINPYGGTTVSVRDYQRNRNFQDIRYRLLPWLLGDELKDERCLWSHFVAINKKGESAIMSSLIESAWVDWYGWWSVHLPKMRN